MLASDFIRVPPRPQDVPPGSSGAPELIISKITEEMVKRGHKVTLFASGNSQTKARLFSLQKKSTGVDPRIGRFNHIDFEYALISRCIQMANRGYFDLIHSHFDERSAFFAPFCQVPIISTLHSPLVNNKKRLLEHFPRTQYYVSISHAQRKNLPQLNYLKTIYHGVELEKIPFSSIHKNYYVFIGRMRLGKAPDKAIELAKKMKKKLFLIGSHDEKDYYWQKKVKPHIDRKKIVYLGHLPQKKVFQVLQYAEAFVFPIQWDEPFGLVMIEAMACGVPVVGFNRGSVPEVVKNGYNGFVVKNEKEALRALKNIQQIKRENCRQWVAKKFTLKRMMDEYEKVYYQVLKLSKK